MRKVMQSAAPIALAITTVAAASLVPATASAQSSEWDVSGFAESALYVREGIGVSKFRNTLQLEASREFGNVGPFSNFTVAGVLRGSYDGVYDITDEYGKGSGSALNFTSVGVPAQTLSPCQTGAIPSLTTPYGSSPISSGFPIVLPPGCDPAVFIPSAFGFDTNINPNSGLAFLGRNLHGANSGVILAYPTQPCDIDPRGCIDGYLDFTENQLKFPEFNDELDFIRELYIDGTLPVGDGGTELGIRLGRQQVVWGRTDLFRVLDVINPVDYSRHNIYDELEDIRIPQWMVNAELRFGATGPFSDLNLSGVYNFDKFRPNNLGQGGTPYSILDAGSFFRAMNTCWEVGCTVGNFAGGGVTTDFGPGQIGIRRANVPDGHDQFGVKLEGVVNEIGFSLNYAEYHSQLPTLRGGIPAQNSFTGQPDTVWPYLIAFDIDFPEVKLYGGSLDIYNDALGVAIRLEGAYTTGEEFANTLQERLFSESDVLRYVVGVDRTFFVPGMPSNSGLLVSGQVFGEHILDHQLEETAGSSLGIPGFGPAGIPNWKDNWTSTLLLRQPFKNGLVNAQVITAYDIRAKAGAVAPSVEWLISDSWKLTVGANLKFGKGAFAFDDCRTCNPWTPFTATPLHPVVGGLPQPGTVGLSGFEPLGRFRQGPLGSALTEDEVQVTIRYRF